MSFIPTRREISRRDAVCDDHFDELTGVVVALRRIGDAIWLGDQGMSPLERLANK